MRKKNGLFVALRRPRFIYVDENSIQHLQVALSFPENVHSCKVGSWWSYLVRIKKQKRIISDEK